MRSVPIGRSISNILRIGASNEASWASFEGAGGVAPPKEKEKKKKRKKKKEQREKKKKKKEGNYE